MEVGLVVSWAEVRITTNRNIPDPRRINRKLLAKAEMDSPQRVVALPITNRSHAAANRRNE